MSRSDWGIVVTIIGCLTLASIGLWDHQQQYKAKIYCEGSATNQDCRPQQYVTERAGMASAFERAISNPQPRTGQDHEKRDLAAQEASAVFAFWMVLISGFGAVVTTLATVLLYQQIRLTREAVEDTSAATEQMRRQNDHAEVTAKKQLRAYLDISDIEKHIERRPDWDEGAELGYKFSIHVDNFGQTPARNVMLANLHGVSAGSLTEAQTANAEPRITFDIAPGGRHQNVFRCNLNEAVLASIESGLYSCFVYCDFQYEDVFGDQHRLRFTLVSSGVMWGDCVFGVEHGSYEST